MQKYTLTFLTVVFLSLTSLSQRLDYDHTSKWFFGFNAGATWSSTDVKNQTNGGWGLTLGKSYNWKTGRIISFDLRGRYLHGNWYGQDHDTSILSNYSGGPLMAYKDTFNMTVHNFLNEQHRLALELVLHANRFAERTNWDPYIFGGIGVTWWQTWGNLYLHDTALYNYPSMVSSGNLSNAITTSSDNTYETRLDQLSGNKWNAKLMPSLGIGLGYNVGPRFQVGIEHKTTFTGIDNWDGVKSNYRVKNDWYHYTSAYMQFRFKTREKDPKQEEQTNNINNINNYTTPCEKPTIRLDQNTATSSLANYTLSFTTTHISNKNTLTIQDANGIIVSHNFNSMSQTVTAPVVLKPGINRFTLFVQNDCGNANATIEVTYTDCRLPNINFSNLIKDSSTTVQQSTLSLSAIVENTQTSNLTLYVNGISRTQFSYNSLNSVFQAVIPLQPGKNQIKIAASNPCGQTFASTEVVYDDCITPTLSMLSPSTNGTTVSVASQIVQVTTAGFSGKNEFNVLLNGQRLNNFTWTNGVLTAPITLVNGNNTLTINGTNRCGSESMVITLNYQQCQAPVITLQNPSNVNITVSKAPYTVKFKTQHQTAQSLMVNNLPVKNYTYNATTGMLEYAFNLLPGANIVTLTSTNTCGVDIETVTITYLNCLIPSVTLGSVGGTVSSSAYVFSANTTGISAAQEVKVTQNGVAIPFAFTAGIVQAISTLNPGANTFVISVTNPCGTQSQTQTVTYNNCLVPSVGLLQPVASGITVNQSAYQLQFTTQNVNNASEITLKLNGITVPFQWLNNVVNASITLNAGVNSIVISVANACGSDSETLQLTYKQCLAPSLVINAPNQLNVSTNQNILNISIHAINCDNAAQVTVFRNGSSVPFSFANGYITLSPSLVAGLNTFTITATNDCGRDIAQILVTYDNCVAPVIALNSSIPVTTQQGNLSFSATVQNITSAAQAALFVNGVGVPFTNNAGVITANVALVAGNNTLSLSATNACGTDVENATIIYDACKSPTITINQPVTSGSTVSSPLLSFTATLENITQSNQINLNLNGTPVNNFQYQNGQLTASLTLINGINTLSLSANNGCGIAQENTTITLSTCNSPSVNILTPSGQTVASGTFSFSAQVQGLANTQGLAFTINGQISPITLTNGTASATAPLQNGQNILMLSATNACGTDTKTIQVNYVPCTAPTISIQTANNTTVTSAAFMLNANVTGVTPAEISLTLNGNPVNNFTLNGTTLSANLTLFPGANQIILVAQNGCGFDRADLNVTYQNCTAPAISLGSMSDTVTQGVFTFTANISNMPTLQGISMSLNGQSVSNFTYSNGILVANLNLSNGNNTLMLTTTNACGTASKTVQVYYDHCQIPVISVISALQASDGQYTYVANIQHVNDIEGMYFTFNGQNVPFNFVNGQLTATVNVNIGANTFFLSAGNNCGNDSETTVVNFANCNPPVLTLVNPSAASSNVAVAAYLLNFSLQNVNNSGEISLTQNGVTLAGITLVGNSATLPVMLQLGVNTFNISVNNGCGMDQNSFVINYTPINNNNDNNNNGNGGKPANNYEGGGGKTPLNNTPAPAPVKPEPPKPANTPAPAPVKPEPPKPTNTPAPAPVKPEPPKPANTPAPAPVNAIKPFNKPNVVEPGKNEVKPEEKQPEKGGGR